MPVGDAVTDDIARPAGKPVRGKGAEKTALKASVTAGGTSAPPTSKCGDSNFRMLDPDTVTSALTDPPNCCPATVTDSVAFTLL